MILFRHAQIYDGTSQKSFLGDVLVRNDRIAEVGQNLEVPEDTEIDGTGEPAYMGSIGIAGDKIVVPKGDEEAKETIDAAGRVLCPGFIDIHRHADVQTRTFPAEANLRVTFGAA